MIIYGLDFTSAPGKQKPITLARCNFDEDVLALERVECLYDFSAFDAFLQRPGPWVAGLDFPFGQPQALVQEEGWGDAWEAYVRRVGEMGKDCFIEELAAYRNRKPAGQKQPRRCTDVKADSRSPMMLFGVPVGKMFLEGAPRLLHSHTNILPCRPRHDDRIVLEAYPGLAVKNLVGKRSYKNDTKRKQTPERREARVAIVQALRSAAGREHYGLSVRLSDDWAQQFIQDGSGDRLDALLCALQAAWAYTKRQQNYGIPPGHELEGWIVDPGIEEPPTDESNE